MPFLTLSCSIIGYSFETLDECYQLHTSLKQRFLLSTKYSHFPTNNPFFCFEVELIREEGDEEIESDRYILRDILGVKLIESPSIDLLREILRWKCPDEKTDLIVIDSKWETNQNLSPLIKLYEEALSISKAYSCEMMLQFHVDFLRRLQPKVFSLLKHYFFNNRNLLYFWQDFIDETRKELDEKEIQQLRVPLERIWNWNFRFKQTFKFDPRCPSLSIDTGNREILGLLSHEIKMGRNSLETGDLLFIANNESIFKLMNDNRSITTWVMHYENDHFIGWEHVKNFRENSRLVVNLRKWKVNFYKDDEIPDLRILALSIFRNFSNLSSLISKLTSSGFFVMTAAPSATAFTKKLYSTFELTSSSEKLTHKKVAVFWANRMSSTEISRLLEIENLECLYLLGDPSERGPPYLRGKCGSIGGGEPFRDIIEHFCPNEMPSEDYICRIISEMNLISKKLHLRTIDPPREKDRNAGIGVYLPTVVRNLKKLFKTSLTFSCCGQNANELKDIVLGALKSTRPKFTHQFYLSDRSELVLPIKVVDNNSIVISGIEEMLKREESSQNEMYLLQYLLLPEQGKLKRSYRKKKATIPTENGTTLDTNIHILDENGHSGEEVANDLVISTIIDGASIEGVTVFRHDRISPKFSSHLVHISGIGASLEDIYSSIKYATEITVILADKTVAALKYLPVNRKKSTSSLSLMLSKN